MSLASPHDSLAFYQSREQLPEFTHEVEHLELIRHEEHPLPGIASITTRLALMSDGSRNVLKQIEAEDRQFEPHFRFTTPLATRVKGFNTYMGIKMAQAGMDVDILGAPQRIGNDPYIPHEAYTFAKVMEYVDETENGPTTSVFGGLSQGAMKAPGIIAYMRRLGMAAPLAIVQDPCLAKETGLVETALTMTPSYLKDEIVEIGKCLVERNDESYFAVGKRALRLAGTVSPSIKYLKTHARVTRELWRGEAGDMLAHLPPETVMIMHFFTHSRMNQSEAFEQKSKHLPYVRAVHQKGTHLTMVSPTVTANYVDQVVRGQEMYAAGRHQSEIARALERPIVKPVWRAI